MRKTLMTAALVFALCCTAFAGEMHTPAAPTPPPANATQEPTGGEMQNGQPTLNGYIPNGVADSLTQTVLELLAVLPSLL